MRGDKEKGSPTHIISEGHFDIIQAKVRRRSNAATVNRKISVQDAVTDVLPVVLQQANYVLNKDLSRVV